MKNQHQVSARIAEIAKQKKVLLNEYIKAIDKEQQDFYTSEIMRHNFMMKELEWVLKP